MSTIVSVYLIDSGKLIKSCRDKELIHLEDEFRAFPPQAVQIRIANCVPCDLDSEWDATITGIVQKWLEEASIGLNVHVEGRIELSAMNTLWLDTLRVVEQLPRIELPVQIMSVGRNLLNKQFAIVDKRALMKLTSLAKSAGIWKKMEDEDLPPIEVVTEQQPLVVSKVTDISQQRGRRYRCENLMSPSLSSSQVSSPKEKPVAKKQKHCWAELDSNEFQEVYISTYFSPRLFYVQKYSDR